MENQTIIFLPDISGFTEFVNKTEIEHSQHIIAELLETIINSQHLNFTISEIEGDAILFYKNSSIPSFKEILDQSKEMFLNFHKHLKKIEVNSVCQCGACRTASNLSLKFITHVGKIKEVKIKEFNKLIGSDLILAHRLLKNSITSNEYLLLTENFLNKKSATPIPNESWIKIENNNEEIDKFGLVASKYIDLKPLLDFVPNKINEAEVEQYNRKPDICIEINASILLVHNTLIDPIKKYEFVPGIKKIITNNKINRLNTSHTCVFENSEIHFVTKNNLVENNKITYSEEAEFGNKLKFIADYRLHEKKDKTTLSIYFSISRLKKSTKSSLIKRIKEYFFLKFIIFKNKMNIKSFKYYCESI